MKLLSTVWVSTSLSKSGYCQMKEKPAQELSSNTNVEPARQIYLPPDTVFIHSLKLVSKDSKNTPFDQNDHFCIKLHRL